MVYYGDQKNSMFKTFQHAPGRTKHRFQYYTTSEECALPGTSFPGISVFRSFDEKPLSWSGEGSAGEGTLIDWMNRESVPHFFDLDDHY